MAEDNRKLAISIENIAESDLTLQQVKFTEIASSVPVYYVDLLAQDIDAKNLLGKAANIELCFFNGSENSDNKRVIKGFIKNVYTSEKLNAQQIPQLTYSAEIVPWMWFLTQNSHTRSFEKQTVKSILEAVFNDYASFATPQFKLQTNIVTTVKQPLIVQYNETDFEFVSRLMEQFGIYYVTSPELIIADNTSGYQKNDHLPNDLNLRAMDNWRRSYSQAPANIEVVAHDYEKRETPLKASKKTTNKNQTYGNLVSFGNNFSITTDGQDVADAEIARYESSSEAVRGSSTNMGLQTLAAGQKLNMSDLKEEFFVKAVSVFARDTRNTHAAPVADTVSLNVEYELIPATQRFVPPLTTPIPSDGEYHEATVIADDNSQELQTDEFGRVMVQTIWGGKFLARVLQGPLTAGVPRVGSPVIVQLHGLKNPMPVIIGQIDDDKQKPLYPLDAANKAENQVKSGLQQRPGKNGKVAEYNQLTFIDSSDKTKAGVFTTVPVGRHELHVEGDITQKTENGGVVLEALNGPITIKAQGCSITLKDGSISVEAEQDINFIAKNNVKTNAMKDIDITALGSYMLNVASGYNLKAGVIDLNAKGKYSVAAMSIELNAQTTIILKGGTTAKLIGGVKSTIGAQGQVNTSVPLHVTKAALNQAKSG